MLHITRPLAQQQDSLIWPQCTDSTLVVQPRRPDFTGSSQGLADWGQPSHPQHASPLPLPPWAPAVVHPTFPILCSPPLEFPLQHQCKASTAVLQHTGQLGTAQQAKLLSLQQHAGFRDHDTHQPQQDCFEMYRHMDIADAHSQQQVDCRMVRP